MNTKHKIVLGAVGALLWIIGDYLLGINTYTYSFSSDMSISFEIFDVPDWRLGVSALLGFLAVPFVAIASIELMRLFKEKYALEKNVWYKLFCISNWTGILYFAFVHIGICMLVVIYNASYSVLGDVSETMDIVFRVVKIIAIPMLLMFLFSDGLLFVSWWGLILKKKLPLPKMNLVCTPVITVMIGTLFDVIPLPFSGINSGFESLGWLLMYMVCARNLTE